MGFRDDTYANRRTHTCCCKYTLLLGEHRDLTVEWYTLSLARIKRCHKCKDLPTHTLYVSEGLPRQKPGCIGLTRNYIMRK